MPDERKAVVVRLDPETKRKLDIALAEQQTTAQHVLSDLLRCWLTQQSPARPTSAGELREEGV